MWAQGLTIGLLIAAGALTQTRRAAMAAEVCRVYHISLLIYNSTQPHLYRARSTILGRMLYVHILLPTITFMLITFCVHQLAQHERERQEEAALEAAVAARSSQSVAAA